MTAEVRDTTPDEWAEFGWGSPMAKAASSLYAGAVAVRDLSGLVEYRGKDVDLGPGEPTQPVAWPEGGPRQFDYPASYNTQQTPRAYESVSFALLRALSQNYDVARIAIETRIAEIRALDWAIIPKAVDGQTRREAAERRKKLQGRITDAEKFWESPDHVSDFGTWVGEYLDDLLSIDAPCLSVRPNRGGGAWGLEVVDGATIRPIIDIHGRPPEAPLPAYGQVIHGMTWGLYTRDELLYFPYRKRTRSPYGYPPLEWVMLTVNRALRRQTLDLSMYTEGTMPVSFYRMPEGWTGTQLRELQDILDDILSGNDALRSRVRLMPGGTGTGLDPVHPEPKSDVEEWLMTVTAAAFGTNPTELGFQPKGIGLGGKGFQEAQEAINYRKNLRPLGRHMKYVHDFYIQRYMDEDLEWQWTGLIEEADQLKQAQTDEIYWRIGVYSSDFIARKQDVDPPGLGHIIAYNGNVIPVQSIIDTYGEFDSQINEGQGDPGDPETTPPMQPALPAVDKMGNVNGQKDPRPGGNGPNKPGTTQIAKASASSDLMAWRRKAQKSVRMGKRASVPFSSEMIDEDTAAAIRDRLAHARTVEEVRRAFEGAGNGPTAPFGLVATEPSESFGPSTLRSSLHRVRQFYEGWDSPRLPEIP